MKMVTGSPAWRVSTLLSFLVFQVEVVPSLPIMYPGQDWVAPCLSKPETTCSKVGVVPTGTKMVEAVLEVRTHGYGSCV